MKFLKISYFIVLILIGGVLGLLYGAIKLISILMSKNIFPETSVNEKHCS